MCCCKTPNAKRIPDTAEFYEHFEQAFRELCVDYAFLEEFLSRQNLLGKTAPSTAHQAANNVFWTYRDSLYLGAAKLADGDGDALSLQKLSLSLSESFQMERTRSKKRVSLLGQGFYRLDGKRCQSIHRDLSSREPWP